MERGREERLRDLEKVRKKEGETGNGQFLTIWYVLLDGLNFLICAFY
jgi:hypothetical protein